MRALTSTASISYITKHASFDKELKSPGKLNGGETRCLVYTTLFFLQRFRVFFMSVYAFTSHSLVNALLWTYLHNECCKCGVAALSERGYNVTVTNFLLHGQVKFFCLLNKGSKLKNARVNISAFFKMKNNNNGNERNNSVCGLKSCGLMRCKPVTFCSCCLQDATTTKKRGTKSKPCGFLYGAHIVR